MLILTLQWFAPHVSCEHETISKGLADTEMHLNLVSYVLCGQKLDIFHCCQIVHEVDC